MGVIQASSLTLRKQWILAFVLVLNIASAQVPSGDWIQQQRDRALEQQQQQQRLQQQRWEQSRDKTLLAQSSTQLAQAVALLRLRQEITNKVYSRFPKPISSHNRIIDGKLYSTNGWVNVVTNATKNGSHLAVTSIGENSIFCDVFKNVLEDTVLAKEKVKTVVIYNHPEHTNLSTGQVLRFCFALRVEDWRADDLSLAAYDCGLPDTFENRERAGIPIPTAEQITAAENEIKTGLRELAEKHLAAKRQKTEMVADKRKAAEAKALKWNQEQAEKGDSYGLFRMGERFRDGLSVEKDLNKAREYFEKAAAAGSPSAADALAKMSQSSTNVPTTK